MRRARGFLRVGLALLLIATSVAVPAAIPQKTQAQTPTPTSGSCATYKQWFSKISSVSIRIDGSGSAVPPPYVSVPADASVSRPALKFTLSAALREGGNGTSNKKYLFFQGNQVNSGGSLTAIPDLLFTTNDGGISGIGTKGRLDSFLYAPGASPDTIVTKLGGIGLVGGFDGNCGDYVIDPPGNLDSNDQEIKDVFGYLLDLPKDGGKDCPGSSGVYLTGPNSPDGRTIKEIQAKYGSAVTGADGTSINADCIDTSDTGWLHQWQVAIADNLGTGGCGAKDLFFGNVGDAFNKLAQCLFKSVFIPIIAWAAGLVQSAAGVSYTHPPIKIAEGLCRFT